MELRSRCGAVLLMSEKRQRIERVLQDKLETFINQYSLINQGSGFVSNFLALRAKAKVRHVLSRRMFEQSEFTARWHIATQSLESEPSRGFLVPFVPTKGT